MKLKLILMIQIILFVTGSIIGAMSLYSKLIISALFVVTAISYFLKEKIIYYKFTLPAMAFCFLGDIATSDLIPGGLITAMLLFGIGHILFILGYYKTTKNIQGYFQKRTFILFGLCYYILFVFVWIFIILPSGLGTFFIFAALIYGVIASTMSSMAASLAQVNKVYLPAAVGAALFWFSDTMIAVNLTKPFPGIDFLIMLTYFLAVGLIIHTVSFKKNKSSPQF